MELLDHFTTDKQTSRMPILQDWC